MLNIATRDPAREDEGEWVELSELEGITTHAAACFAGVRLKLRSPNSPIWQKRRAELAEKYPPEKDPDEEQQRCTLNRAAARTYAEVGVLDWEGVYDDETGADVPCTPDVVYDALRDRSSREFEFAVVLASTAVGRREAASLGKSERPSKRKSGRRGSRAGTGNGSAKKADSTPSSGVLMT